jgi:hypothetical protein
MQAKFHVKMFSFQSRVIRSINEIFTGMKLHVVVVSVRILLRWNLAPTADREAFFLGPLIM